MKGGGFGAKAIYVKRPGFPGENAGFITHGDVWDVETSLGFGIRTSSDLRSCSSISRTARSLRPRPRVLKVAQPSWL